MQTLLSHSRITIVGLGQLGGSLALRLKQLGCASVYAVTRRDETWREARKRGMIDGGGTDAAAWLPLADICILCIPLTASVAFVREHLEHFRPGCLVTDVGSVKGPLVAELRARLQGRGVYFVGSHPMAGTERSGLAAADPELFRDAVCFLTPTPADDEEVLTVLRQCWEEVGMRIIELPAERHDAAVAYASHLLHLLSVTATNAILSDGDVEARELAAAGAFRDVTRIAGGNVEMWLDICRHNTPAILAAMDSFREQLEAIRQALAAGDFETLAVQLAAAHDRRLAWAEARSADSEKEAEA